MCYKNLSSTEMKTYEKTWNKICSRRNKQNWIYFSVSSALKNGEPSILYSLLAAGYPMERSEWEIWKLNKYFF